MSFVNKLTVKYRDTTVGTVMMDPMDEKICFQYDKDWLRNGFSISPLTLPLKDTLFIAKDYPFNGNFGVFEDCLPDGYGRYLLDRMLKKKGYDFLKLKPIEWLGIVGNNGMGALYFEPSLIKYEDMVGIGLDELQDMALNTLAGKEIEDISTLYFKLK